ncbi:MAG: alpha/beta fold hydrolase [Paenibacillaceae bacterium]|nr:alpha/beta fold hydrolase [Paenibacillaceae bacterium]
MEHAITIASGSGSGELSAVLHYPKQARGGKGESGSCRWPLIVVCHGFVGNKIGENRLFVKAARAFSEAGFLVIRFDYAGCGESTGEYGGEGGGLDAMIGQTQRVLDYGLGLDCVDANRVTLLGHSLGGAVAVLTAARDNRVKSLVLWSAVAHPLNDIVGIVGKQAYEEAVALGTVDHRGYRLSAPFFESLTRHQPLRQVRQFRGDALLLHGTLDDVIPVDYCFLYQRVFWLRSDGQCDKEVILQADHTYSADKSAQQLIAKTADWLTYLEKRKMEWHDWTI